MRSRHWSVTKPGASHGSSLASLIVRMLLLASAMQHARDEDSVASRAVVDDIFTDWKLPRASLNVVRRYANAGSRGKRAEFFMQEVEKPVSGRLVVFGDILPDADQIRSAFADTRYRATYGRDLASRLFAVNSFFARPRAPRRYTVNSSSPSMSVYSPRLIAAYPART